MLRCCVRTRQKALVEERTKKNEKRMNVHSSKSNQISINNNLLLNWGWRGKGIGIHDRKAEGLDCYEISTCPVKRANIIGKERRRKFRVCSKKNEKKNLFSLLSFFFFLFLQIRFSAVEPFMRFYFLPEHQRGMKWWKIL